MPAGRAAAMPLHRVRVALISLVCVATAAAGGAPPVATAASSLPVSSAAPSRSLPATAASPSASAWRVEHVGVGVGGYGPLADVSCPSSTFCVAVGRRITADGVPH